MKKGFTLIELLVVIAILAILATVIVVIINPGELLKQARDTSRISDLAALNNAIALYLSDVVSPLLMNGSACTTGATAGYIRCTGSGATSPFTAGGACTQSTSTAITGAGWAAINFTSISSGSPLPRLPMDPTNNGTYFYAYACGGGTNATNYELNAKMESTKYSSATTGVMRNEADGGNNANFYEIGNYLTQ